MNRKMVFFFVIAISSLIFLFSPLYSDATPGIEQLYGVWNLEKSSKYYEDDRGSFGTYLANNDSVFFIVRDGILNISFPTTTLRVKGLSQIGNTFSIIAQKTLDLEWSDTITFPLNIILLGNDKLYFEIKTEKLTKREIELSDTMGPHGKSNPYIRAKRIR